MIASILPTYSRAPLTFVSGEGSWLTEADGRRFLDLGAGIAVNALGHAHAALVDALTGQAQALMWLQFFRVIHPAGVRAIVKLDQPVVRLLFLCSQFKRRLLRDTDNGPDALAS